MNYYNLKMKYKCNNCNEKFDEDLVNKEIPSLLTRSLIITCIYCGSNNINLSDQGKLQVDRKAKLKKLKNSSNFE